MKNKIRNITAFLVFVSALVAFFVLKSPDTASASSGVCEDAAELGVCVGSGAKCNIKKGWFTFECGKDPNGESIIIEVE